MGLMHSKIGTRMFSFGGSSRRGEGSGGGSGSGNGSTSDPSTSTLITRAQYTSELESYDKACKTDPDLSSFNSALQERTRLAIDAIQSDARNSTVSLNSLRAATNALFDTNHDAVELILKCKEEIHANPKLSDLVVEYLDSSCKTLEFCVSLNGRLQKARDRQLILRVALKCFEQEDGAPEPTVTQYAKTLEELRRFKEAGDPFTAEFFTLFNSVYEQQNKMIKNLQSRKGKLDKKLKNVRAWRRISTVVFVSTFSALLICSVVAAAMVAPPVVVAVLSAGTVAVGPMGKWFNSMWKGYVDKLKEDRKAVKMMEKGAEITIEELRSIGALVARLESVMEALLNNAEFASRGEEAVKIGMEEIERKLGEFLECIELLERESHKCSDFVVKARAVVLKMAMQDG